MSEGIAVLSLDFFNCRKALKISVRDNADIEIAYTSCVRSPGMYIVPEHMCRRGKLGTANMYSVPFDVIDGAWDGQTPNVIEQVITSHIWNDFPHLVFPAKFRTFRKFQMTTIGFQDHIFVPTEEDAILLGLMEKTL